MLEQTLKGHLTRTLRTEALDYVLRNGAMEDFTITPPEHHGVPWMEQLISVYYISQGFQREPKTKAPTFIKKKQTLTATITYLGGNLGYRVTIVDVDKFCADMSKRPVTPDAKSDH
jgi:hypothetical protein